MKPMTEQHLALFRRHMVEIIEMHFDLSGEEIGKDEPDPALRRALMDVPRHLFVPQSLMLMSYQDTPLPIGFDKTISQPFIGALMLELLGVAPETRVLEVRGGVLEGRPITAADIENLAKLPPLDQLRGQVLGGITSPLYAVVGLFAAPLQNLVGLIDARIEQLGDGGAEAPEQPAAEATAEEAPAEEAPSAEDDSNEND